jgi:hypothetical protein
LNAARLLSAAQNLWKSRAGLLHDRDVELATVGAAAIVDRAHP